MDKLILYRCKTSIELSRPSASTISDSAQKAMKDASPQAGYVRFCQTIREKGPQVVYVQHKINEHEIHSG